MTTVNTLADDKDDAPVEIVHDTPTTLEGLKQFHIAVENEEWKLETLTDLFDTVSITSAIIYCNTQEKVEWLAEQLRSREITVSVIPGIRQGLRRAEVIWEYNSSSSRVLLTTDPTIRATFDHVGRVLLAINYDFPKSKETYLSRVGRGGRFGRKGVVISFVDEADMEVLKSIENSYKTTIIEMPLNVADVI